MAILCWAAKNSLRAQMFTLQTSAADAAIWAEQQLVAILGWLCEDQNARLDKEGQLA